MIAKVDENIAYCSKLQGKEVDIVDNEAYGTCSIMTISKWSIAGNIALGQQQSTDISREISVYTDIVKIKDNVAYGPVSPDADHALDIESSYAAVLEYDYIHIEAQTDVQPVSVYDEAFGRISIFRFTADIIALGQQQSTDVSGETNNTDTVKMEDNVAYCPASPDADRTESSYSPTLEYDYIHVKVPTDVQPVYDVL